MNNWYVIGTIHYSIVENNFFFGNFVFIASVSKIVEIN